MLRTEDEMGHKLSEVSGLPEVLGLFVYINQVGIKYPDLPKWCPELETAQIGHTINGLLSLNHILNRRRKNIEIKLESLSILAAQIDNDASLIAICKADTDPSVFETATKKIIPELKKAIAFIPRPSPPEKDSGAAEQESQEEGREHEEIVAQEEAVAVVPEKTLLLIRDSLARAIGPVHEIVMKETIEKWTEEGEATIDRIGELVDMLCREIGDKEREKEFRSELDIQGAIIDPLSKLLSRIQEALARAIGPVHEIVMKETIEKWTKGGVPSMARIDELVDMLCLEIDDKAREEEFRKAI